MFPDILGVVFELAKNGVIEEVDFYGLTTHGITNLRKCRKPGGDFHDECDKKSYYTSKMHLVEEIDDPLEVHDFFTISNPEGQLYENEWPTIEESLKRKTKPSADVSMEIEENDETNQTHAEVPMEEEVQVQDEFPQNEMEVEIGDLPPEDKECEGCGRLFKVDKLLSHIGHWRNKECMAVYGPERYEQMKKQNKIIVERKREEKRSGLRKDYQAKNYAEHKEVRLEKAKHNHIKNKEVRNVNSKERRKATKIENSKFEKRLQKFKEETKHGPSFGCQCCHRALFYRGMKLI